MGAVGGLDCCSKTARLSAPGLVIDTNSIAARLMGGHFGGCCSLILVVELSHLLIRELIVHSASGIAAKSGTVEKSCRNNPTLPWLSRRADPQSRLPVFASKIARSCYIMNAMKSNCSNGDTVDPL